MIELSDILSGLSIIISVCVASVTWYKKSRNKRLDNQFSHRSAIFDSILLNEVPDLLSCFLDDFSNVEVCDQLTEKFIRVKQMSVIYYLGDKLDDYYELKNLVVQIDEQLINISSDDPHDKDDLSDSIIQNIKKVYRIIYNDSIA